MKLLIKLFFIVSFLFLFPFVKPSFAVFSFNIASVSATTISAGNQEIDVSLNITSLPNESYFRVALQKESGGSYLGYVKNNSGDWSAIQPLSGDCTIYYKISDTSTTSLALKFKVGDDVLIDSGNYNLKAHRFTKTCTSYTEATNSYNLTVNLPTPTPTPSPTASQTPTPTPTSTPTPTPTFTPSPSPTNSLVPSKTPAVSLTPTPLELLLEESISDSAVLSTEDAATVKPTSTAVKTLSESETNFSRLFIALGAIILGVSGILGFLTIRKNGQ